MSWYLILGLVVIYFLMGIGTYNLAVRIKLFDKSFKVVPIFFWFLVILISAFFDDESNL